jgi:predicted nucleic acid-binding protein
MATYLADKSALVRVGLEGAEWLAAEIMEGNVRRSSMTDLEILYSGTSHHVLLEIIEERQTGFRLVDTHQEDWDRAVEVMVLLAEKGKHRSVGIPDLLIAAVAERHGLTLVHYDSDFDHVAEVTGQTTRWVAPRGTW